MIIKKKYFQSQRKQRKLQAASMCYGADLNGLFSYHSQISEQMLIVDSCPFHDSPSGGGGFARRLITYDWLSPPRRLTTYDLQLTPQ